MDTITSSNPAGTGIEAISQDAAIGSAANAVQHGLTAKKFIPAILGPGRVEELTEQLEHELRPTCVTERLLVREIARHCALLEVAEHAEGAVLRMAVTALAPMLASPEGDVPEDAALAAAVTTDSIEKLTRYRRAHEKAMHQALERLRERQAARRIQVSDQRDRLQDLFATEEACRAQLRARFGAKTWQCPHCPERHGYWLDSREKWECASCGKQVGLRHGTVFAGSPLPLVTWFAAVGHVMSNPRVSAAELGRLLSLSRPATAQTVLRRIHQAIKAGGTSLGGVDAYC